jgi:DNA-binding NarL/FixJ family response regulator
MGTNRGTICEGPIRDEQDETVITNQIRVLSVDAHPLKRQGIATVINAQADMHVVAQASSVREAIQRFGEHMPNVILMDLRLPDMNGIDAMIAIRKRLPEVRIMVFTIFEGDTEIRRAFAAGACSYVLKSTRPNDLAETIRQVQGGKKLGPAEVALRITEHFSDDPLTEREVDVLKPTMGGTEIGTLPAVSSSRGRP